MGTGHRHGFKLPSAYGVESSGFTYRVFHRNCCLPEVLLCSPCSILGMYAIPQ